jgi:aromatic-L-amino-acid/L-tryptophan decarboxylase
VLHGSRGSASRFGRRLLELTLDEFWSGDHRRAYSGASAARLERLFSGPLPEKGTSDARLLRDLRETIFRHSMRMGHPRLYGLFTPAPIPAAAFAGLPAAFLNQAVDAWKAGPAATEIEKRLVRWMNDRIGFGPRAFGVLTSGGGMANAIALKMARDRAAGFGVRRLGASSRRVARLRVYASDQSHFSLARSLDLIGLGTRALIQVPTDASRRMRGAALERALRRDRRRGLVPMAVVATAGTTVTGSIDALPEIALVARTAGAPLHVDAAYGGALLFSNRHRGLLAGIEHAATVTFDPHKWLFQPFSLGALLARDGAALRRSFATEPDYLSKDLDAERDRLDFFQYTFEGSKPFRGLKLWMSLRSLGRRGIGELVDGTVDVARHLAARVAADPRFEDCGAPVDLASVCVRYLPAWARGHDRSWRRRPAVRAPLNRVQSALQREVERRGFAWFPIVRLEGEVYFRLGIFNYRTTTRDVDATLAHIARVARALGLEGTGASPGWRRSRAGAARRSRRRS